MRRNTLRYCALLAVGGDEGVKLEQPVLITRDGIEPLTTCPFEEDYL